MPGQKVYEYPGCGVVMTGYYRQTPTDKAEIIAQARKVIQDMQVILSDPNKSQKVQANAQRIIDEKEEFINREEARLNHLGFGRKAAEDFQRLTEMVKAAKEHKK